MDATDWAIVSCIVMVFSGIASGFWMMLGRYMTDRGIIALEARLKSLEMTILSRKGENVRSENREEDDAFMAQIGAMLQAGKPMDEILKSAMATNPKAALRLVKKLGIPI